MADELVACKCGWCGRWFIRQHHMGRQPKFCSRTCRQKAYIKRSEGQRHWWRVTVNGNAQLFVRSRTAGGACDSAGRIWKKVHPNEGVAEISAERWEGMKP